MTRTIRIGNGAGFWGDSPAAPRRLAEGGGLDYLTLEYLAELTMSILAGQQAKDPGAGFVTDFPAVVESLVPVLQGQPGLKIVTNAGGMNPAGCAAAVSRVLAEAGLGENRVAAVGGDDVYAELGEHIAAGEEFANLDTGEALSEIRERAVSVNAYLGAAGIVEALRQNARIVVTGRVADASLTVGPAVHEFGWGWSEWDRLAAASTAGHLIECGAQVTGGMYSDWNESLPLADVGYPIAEITADGGVIITKPDGTGGAVGVGTVSEQLVYEIGDPAAYLTPDVAVDFTQVRLEQVGENRVRVSGARGRPAPETYKVSLAYTDGFMVSGTLVIAGRDAEAKARAAAEMIFDRVRRAGYELERTHVECLGAGDSLPGMALARAEPWEVVLRVVAQAESREAVECLAREIAPLVTSGPPGVTGYTGGRPKPHPVLAYWPAVIDKSRVAHRVTAKTAEEWL